MTLLIIKYTVFNFQSLFLFSEIIADIVKNCEFETDEKDDVIIKQGEKGEWYELCSQHVRGFCIIKNPYLSMMNAYFKLTFNLIIYTFIVIWIWCFSPFQLLHHLKWHCVYLHQHKFWCWRWHRRVCLTGTGNGGILYRKTE